MKIPNSTELQKAQPEFHGHHGKKMHAISHAHLTHLAATAKAVQTEAVHAVANGPTAAQIANSVQGFGDLASIDSLINQYNAAIDPKNPNPTLAASLMANIQWFAADLIQNCLSQADPTAAATLSKMIADFTYTKDPNTGIITVQPMTPAQITSFMTDWEQTSGVEGDKQAWAYIQANGSSLSQTFSTKYPLAALGLFMLSCDNFINPTAMEGEDKYYHNGQGPLHYDDYFLNQNWDSTMPYSQLFPDLILAACYQACCSQTPPYAAPNTADYTAMLQRFQQALPPVSLIDSKFTPPPGSPPGTLPETTFYQQMLNNLNDAITNQNPSLPFIQLPSPPFGPIQGLSFGQNPYNPNDPSYRSFDPVYESIWQDLQEYYT